MSTMTHATTTRRIARAEWTKLRTLPSTWRTAVLTMAMAIGFGVAVAFSEASQWHTMTAQQRQLFDPASASMVGVMIAAVVLGALAVKTVTSEYSTGMIRATFTAMPARPLVLAAKAATVAAFAFPVALLCNVVGFELGQRIAFGLWPGHARLQRPARGRLVGEAQQDPVPLPLRIEDTDQDPDQHHHQDPQKAGGRYLGPTLCLRHPPNTS